MRSIAFALFALFVAAAATPAQEAWKPAEGPLTTPWTEKVSSENVHPEYPRPQMVRKDWTNLNGLWDYAIRPRNEAIPAQWQGKILVPFPIESALSGVMKKVGDENRLWYRRTFAAKKPANDGRLLLRFGAVDWQCQVWINGQPAGEHQGGYDHFALDITDLLRPQGEQEIVVAVWDPSDRGFQPRGKQVNEPQGIWYTSVTGIWQTVWLEPVPATFIDSYQVTPHVDQSAAAFTITDGRSQVSRHKTIARVRVQLTAANDEKSQPIEAFGLPGDAITIKFPDNAAPKLWSPDSPHLYTCEVALHEMDSNAPNSIGKQLDVVSGYFAMRKIALGKDDKGLVRMLLNGKPLFQYGTLDQGWWPDGLYTAPTDEAMRYDIEMTKKLGFNTIRKHVKVEPDRWYYYCDKLGMLVWQDMPNGDRHIGADDPDIVRSAESEENFRREWQEIMDEHRNFPCIVVWVPFNEGWGQFKTAEILAWTKESDPSRLVDGPSGWTDRGVGDIHDMHRYPGPGMPEPEEKRAVVLGEFGGLGLPLEGHLWWNKRNWGYRTYDSRESLWTHYRRLIRDLHPLIGRGLSAAIYTQTTDVEGEVNGLLTYDRRVVKFDEAEMAQLHARLHEPAPMVVVKPIVPTSEKEPQVWRYTTKQPPSNWTAADFDDSSWEEASGGFGEPTTPGSAVRTQWKTSDIWLRREATLPAQMESPHVRIHHDENAEVYINGQPVAKFHGYVVEYFNEELDEKAQQVLKEGRNVIAVHCRQTGGGQYVDVGIVDVIETPRK